MLLADLFFTFLKIGMFTFGGGYAMISIIDGICVERKQWITHEEMMDITVIAESTPGPIAINCATFVGWKQAGIPGSVVTTLGVTLPSFVIIYLISTVLDHFMDYPLIASAFQGIRVGVGLLILSVGWSMLQKMKGGLRPRIIMGCAFAAVLTVNFFSLNFSTIAMMLIAGSVSLALYLANRGGARK